MRLEYIRSFICVVNCKSFSAAAREMFLSQPTISTHIKQLEAELGVQLLVRSTKDVILSEAGVVFYPFAVKLLETENEALAQLNKNEISMRGTVSIATSSVPGNYILPGFLAYARKINPEVNYKLSEGDSSEVIRAVLHFESDFGVGSIKSNNEKCVCQPIFKDRIVLATPNTEEYRKMNGKFPLERLKKETFVVRENGSGTKMAAENIEREIGLLDKPPKMAYQAESSELIRKGVEQGLGVAFISNLAIQEAVEAGRILKFEFPEIDTSRTLYLLYHKERVMTLPIAGTIKILRQYCQELV